MRAAAIAAAVAAASCHSSDVAWVRLSSTNPNSIRVLVRPGQQVKLDASAMNAVSNDPIQNASYYWRTDSPHVTVDQNGLVTAVSDGEAHVFASLDGVESPGWRFTVHIATSVLVTPQPATIRVGASQQFTESPIDPTGNVVSGAPDASWQSTDTSVATVDPVSGVAMGVAAGGPIMIVVSVVGLTGSAQVTVSP
jgi:uncharacterized protein YjdB